MSLCGIKVEGTLEKQTEEILKECEKLMDVAYKASGVSIMDAMDSLDATSGAILGAAMSIYKKSKKSGSCAGESYGQNAERFR